MITADGCDDLADAVEFGNLIIESIMFGGSTLSVARNKQPAA